ncbi:cytochrome c3 family protein [Dissulfurirhabdus thermomarina]|uniref:Cytochrome c3 family protein n=1 Tax=Dissulfurirhabdus thermomarina TaxID=1765737 RepID=A0A6N9TL89_DISTH|nr:cytochrome c3 family protein [Dissulfurirhabdus thermomarina]NDY42041.1 cytochrome c3 family protein [Dissulfurirhabdus thermomarina]NMX22333.1 cytochrome c3 family protein [Dissulfurirhabdus thermomarina]
MKKNILTWLVVGLFAVAGAGVAMAGEGPATIVLKAKKGDVTFAHHKHQARMDCGQCHHGVANGKRVPFKKGQAMKKCEECHNSSMANKKVNKPMKVFHENCKNCHKQHKAEGAPTKCNGCHKK